MPPTLASKLPHVGTTIFSVMSGLAQEYEAINLGQGFPDLPVDGRLITLVHEAIRNGHNQYAPMPGLPALRESIANKVERLYGTAPDPEREITITAGATQAIFTAVAACIRPGDEVVVLDPAYDCYAPAVALFGGIPVHVKLDADMRFDADAVRKALGPSTRMLVINTPHNPAGTILRDGDMRAIAEMLRGTDILLLSDEVYEHSVLDGEQHASALRYPELRDRAFVVFSFGKVFHVTGWKLGYVIAPAPLMNEFRKVHQYNVFAVNTPMQHALATHLALPEHYEGLPELFQRKRDRLVEGLADSGLRVLPCEGSYFLLVDYSALSDAPDTKFAEQLVRDHGVATIPLSPFYKEPPPGQRLLRLCYAKEDATLDAAAARLRSIQV